MAADINPWHNLANPLDVDDNQDITPLDALIVINDLNRYGSGQLGDVLHSGTTSPAGEGEQQAAEQRAPTAMVDVNDDRYLTPSDVLQVVNELNGEGVGEYARVRGRVAQDIPPNPGGPTNRADVTSVTPGQTVRFEVYVQDIRTDDGDGNPSVNNFGVFASYIDVEFNSEAFTIPPGTSDNADGKPVLPFPISYHNPNFLADLDPGPGVKIDTAEFRYPNGPKGDLNTVAVVNDAGSFLEGSTPIGTFEYFHFDVKFTAESILAASDSDSTPEMTPKLIDVLANDKLISGPQVFSVRPPSENGGIVQGNEFLVFGNTGFGTGGPQGEGSVVPENLIEFVNDQVTIVNNGTLNVQIASQGTRGTALWDSVQRKVLYTPTVPGAGTDTFTYILSDGQGNQKTTTVTVTITEVNDPPVITLAQNNLPIDEDQTETLPPGLIMVADPDAGTGELKATVTVNNGTVTLGSTAGLTFTTGDGIADSQMVFTGTLGALNGSTVNASFTPTANFNGNATIVLDVNDQGNTGTGGAKTDRETLTIAVAAVNDPPVNTVPGPQVMPTSGPLVFSTATSNAISVSDPDGNVTVAVNLAVDQGTLNLVNPGTLNVQNNGTASVTVTGLIGTVNTANTINWALGAGLQYTGTLGSHTLTVTTDDQGNIGGGSLTDVDQILIIPPQKPFAVPDQFTVNEGAAPTNLNVLLNDLNGAAVINGPGLTVDSVTQGTQGGGVVDNDTNVIYSVPNADFAGQDTFTYTVVDPVNVPNDGPSTGTVTVTVTQINDAPSFAASDPPAVNEDAGAQSVPSWATFDAGPANEDATQAVSQYIVSDVSNPSLFASGPSVATNGTLSYTPASNQFGTSTFAVVVRDDGGTSNGGVDTSAAQTFTITVNSVNDAPTFTASNPPAVNEGVGAQSVSNFATNFSPGPSNEATQTLVQYLVSDVSNPGLFSASPLVAPNGTLTYTPAADAFGTSTFKLAVQDSGGTANGGVDISAALTLTITVNPVNDAPSFTAANPPAVNEDAGAQTVTGWVTNFNPGPANESSQTVQQYNVGGMSNPALFAVAPAVSPSGTLTYTTAADASGTSTFTVAVQDNGGTANGGSDTSATQTFTVTVNAVNDAPVNRINGSNNFAANAQSTDDNTALPFTAGNGNLLTLTDVDDNGNSTYTLSVSAVAEGSVDPGTLQWPGDPAGANLQATGTLAQVNAKLAGLVYSPPQNFIGTSKLTITSNDGGTSGAGTALPDTDTVTITVAPFNDPPVARNDNVTTAEAASVDFNAFADNGNGVDTAGPNEGFQDIDVLSFNAAGTVGTVQLLNAETGQFRYTPPNNDFNGQTTFTYTIQDNGQSRIGGNIVDDFKTATATVTVTVTEVNDAPVPDDDLLLIAPNPTTGQMFTFDLSELLNGDLPGPTNESTQQLAIVSVTGNAQLVGNTVVYTVPAGFNHVDTFTYNVQDNGTTNGQLDAQTATGNVTVRDVVLTDVSGNVYFDADDDGQRDAIEWGIGGVTITLTGTDIAGDPVLRTTQTDESGYYRFDDVLPSQAGTSYTITEQHPSTLVDGKDTIDDPLKGTSPANDTFTSEIPILGFDVAGSTVQMDFGELGFKAEFGVLNLYNLLHSGGTIDGLMFGTDGEGELQWFLNVGGWDGYVPGTAHSPYRVTIENNRLSLTDTRTSTVRTIDATDEAIRSLYRTSGLVMRIDGGAANFGLPLYDPPAEGEGEAYADAVDAVFAEAGA